MHSELAETSMEGARRLATKPGVLADAHDEELALAARADPAAFGLLYQRHRMAVFLYLRSRTTSADDAAELRLIVASNIVRVELRIGGDLPRGAWAPVGEVRHDGRVLSFVALDLEPPGSPPGTVAIMTDGGVSDVSGDWAVTVSELVGEDVRLAGPWIVEFNAP
jgi:hypothetical protein